MQGFEHFGEGRGLLLRRRADDAAPQVGHHQPIVFALGADADRRADHASQRHQRADGAVVERALHAVRHVMHPAAQGGGDQVLVERQHGRQVLADGFGFRQGVDGRLLGGGEQGRGVEPRALAVLEKSATGRHEEGLRKFFGAGVGTGDLQHVEQLTVEGSPVGGGHGRGERQQHAQASRVGRAALGGVEHKFQPGQRSERGLKVDGAVEVENGGADGADVLVVPRGSVAKVGVDQGRQGVQVLGAGLLGIVPQALDQREPR